MSQVPGEDDLKRVEERIRSINKFAPIQRSTNSNIDVNKVLNIGAFDLKRTLEMDPEFLDTEGEHVHDQSVTSIGINADGDVDLGLFSAWLETLLRDKGADLFRIKGVLSVKDVPHQHCSCAVTSTGRARGDAAATTTALGQTRVDAADVSRRRVAAAPRPLVDLSE